MTEYNEYRVDIEGYLIVKEESPMAAEEEVKRCLPSGFHFRVTQVRKQPKPTRAKII